MRDLHVVVHITCSSFLCSCKWKHDQCRPSLHSQCVGKVNWVMVISWAQFLCTRLTEIFDEITTSIILCVLILRVFFAFPCATHCSPGFVFLASWCFFPLQLIQDSFTTHPDETKPFAFCFEGTVGSQKLSACCFEWWLIEYLMVIPPRLDLSVLGQGEEFKRMCSYGVACGKFWALLRKLECLLVCV